MRIWSPTTVVMTTIPNARWVSQLQISLIEPCILLPRFGSFKLLYRKRRRVWWSLAARRTGWNPTWSRLWVGHSRSFLRKRREETWVLWIQQVLDKAAIGATQRWRLTINLKARLPGRPWLCQTSERQPQQAQGVRSLNRYRQLQGSSITFKSTLLS